MRSTLLMAAAALLLSTAGAFGDEKGGQAGSQGGPPPGKGWRKNESPAPAPKGGKPSAPQAKDYGKKPAAKPQAQQTQDDGIGATVSQWARSGVHGRELAARIHKLQATKAKATPQQQTKLGKKSDEPAAKPGKKQQEPTPAPKGKGKNKPGKGEDD